MRTTTRYAYGFTYADGGVATGASKCSSRASRRLAIASARVLPWLAGLPPPPLAPGQRTIRRRARHPPRPDSRVPAPALGARHGPRVLAASPAIILEPAGNRSCRYVRPSTAWPSSLSAPPHDWLGPPGASASRRPPSSAPQRHRRGGFRTGSASRRATRICR